MSLKTMQKNEPWVGTWRPHKPKGPIAAQYGSPGPVYMLPGLTGAIRHDPTKPKAPAFSITSRRKVANTDCSPGPIYKLPPNYTRYGRDGTLAFSVRGRLNPLAPFCTPGPGQYSPDFSKLSTFKSSPAYTFSSRPKELTKNQTPGPASYKLPPLLGTKGITTSSAPSFTITGRTVKGSFLEDITKTPGPAAYNAADPYISKPKPPQWTMTGRHFPPDKAAKTPGPGPSYPLIFTKPKAPSFSFGIHHSQYRAYF
ncbi:outer dense fiber protein 3-B-like isoform X1 [Fundulus heteroclitus]|uniref:outer dense fiber protein 3-B-like isoform X1 n=2 Tax=Fundulus heteroclitus TaxID=8078 RepID=UPI00165CCFB8|nr:outer dense fiber protein 3-B-like isoform X1 [Fundulus heteroclitus]XP_035986490.1 outer dense fiber protein 3-B-like isoform X1 [Fundulus heteroclitus]